MVQAPKHISAFTYAIKRLCTVDNDFPAAEELFHTLLFDRLRLLIHADNAADNVPAKYTRAQPPFTDEEIMTFQKCMSTLIRYSPNTEFALKYVCFMLSHFDAPLRTRHLEHSALINIIYVLHTFKAYNEALDFIRIGLERGILFDLPNANRGRFDQSADIFRSVCYPVLVYHKLRFSDDNLSLEPTNSYRRT
ncbi:hypothetical protein BX666DRAFT_1877401 [Dichotomocladium elegans]|nr:hypothetical protein BX666DRAFT_1877401 [Dichotomocladium elegans]